MHVNDSKQKAVLYTYDIYPRYKEKLVPIKLQGLDPHKQYEVKEINLMPGKTSGLHSNGQIVSGDYLMKVGIDAFTTNHTYSRIIELTEVN